MIKKVLSVNVLTFHTLVAHLVDLQCDARNTFAVTAVCMEFDWTSEKLESPLLLSLA